MPTNKEVRPTHNWIIQWFWPWAPTRLARPQGRTKAHYFITLKEGGRFTGKVCIAGTLKLYGGSIKSRGSELERSSSPLACFTHKSLACKVKAAERSTVEVEAWTLLWRLSRNGAPAVTLIWWTRKGTEAHISKVSILHQRSWKTGSWIKSKGSWAALEYIWTLS